MNRIETVAFDDNGSLKVSFPREKILSAAKFVRMAHPMMNEKEIIEDFFDAFSGKFIFPASIKAFTIECRLEEDLPF